MSKHAPPEIAVYVELGSKRAFACAFDWPGWCRAGKDEAGALDALAASAPRYAAVAAEAALPFPMIDRASLRVVERLPGSATTDFGAPGAIAPRDYDPLTQEEAARFAALVKATWVVFDRVVATAPAELRKGPRGGGRDRDAVVAHVVAAEAAYARKLGIRHPEPARGDLAALAQLRAAIVQALSEPREITPTGKGWPARYAASRIAWHVLDHAWEIEDRSES